jgi:hypothetical protein
MLYGMTTSVYNVCEQYIRIYAYRDGGGADKCARQPARVSLFRDRVMRRKSNIISLLYQSDPIMREKLN